MRSNHLKFKILILAGWCVLVAAQNKQEGDPNAAFKRWLKEDVAYIISEPERSVFLSLTTPEEKERFIEQFWKRRDPTPETSQNEFKEEHYRRIQFANERFAAGRPGWMTDRGMVYIRFGKPDGQERRPTGGAYVRPQSEGGGITTANPFEVWRYNYMEGVGSDVQIEFVDEFRTGDYRILMHSNQKDALLHVPGAGMTEYELDGMETRANRMLREGLATSYPGPAKDLPFERLGRIAAVTRPADIKYHDLRVAVAAKVTYNLIPLKVSTHQLRLSQDRALVSIAMEIPNSSLKYVKNETIYRAELEIFGRITDVTGRLISEFEDNVVSEHNDERRPMALNQKSLYQKLLNLKGGTYKLELFVRDPESKQLGSAQERLAIPLTYPPTLACSPVLLASRIEEVAGVTGNLERFAIGDLKVQPNVTGTFAQGDIVGIYFHAYGAQLDAATGKPSLSVRYHILQNNRMVRAPLIDAEGLSVRFVSEVRAVFVYGIATDRLPPGSYRLLIRIKDQVSGQEATADALFSITAPLVATS